MHPTALPHRAAYAAGAVLLALATAACGTAGGTAPPARQSATTAAASGADVVRHGSLADYATDAHGDLMTVWTRCDDQDHCRWAWRLAGAGGASVVRVGRGEPPSVYGAATSFVLRRWDREGVVVGRDGAIRPIRPVERGAVTASDVLVRVGKGLAVVDPARAVEWPLPPPAGTEGWDVGTVQGDGTVWATSFRFDPTLVQVGHSEDGRAWTQHVVSDTREDGTAPSGLLAVAGDHVATMSSYDGATVLPVGVLAVTTDGGATWTHLRPEDLPFRYVDAMAATAGGTLYVAPAGARRLYRSTDATWTRFAVVPGSRGFDRLQPDGDRVLAGGGTLADPELVTFDDAGDSHPWPARLR